MEPIVVVGGPYHGALHERLEHQSSQLEKRGIRLQVQQDSLGPEPSLVCRFHPPEPDAVCRSAVACAVADVIGDQCRTDLITRLLRREYGYFDPDERRELSHFIERKLQHASSPDGEPPPRRQVIGEVSRYLSEERHLCLGGFLTFRLRDYQKGLARTVDRAVDEFVLQREYREFVRLLRFFVNHQQPEELLLHAVVTGDGTFHLLTAGGTPLDSEAVNRVLADLTQENLETGDLLVSALVTVAPRTLVAHGLNHLDGETRETISQVFGDRLKRCEEGCQLCQGPLPDEQPLDRV